MDDNNILTLTADVVGAHVSNNTVSADELPKLIQSVYDALANAGAAPVAVEETREPSVSIRSSVRPDSVACLECGKRMKMLKRHLGIDHNLTPAAYRERWSLKADYPLVAPEYAAKRAELAKKIGLGRKLGSGKKARAKRPSAAVTN